ncbi:hypothetical protein [Mycobacterium parmense]|uniref:Uncharacterized protein n=1 Tax=Mycobacterium parmense TaxID=185642 RepID=A0A7I7YMQ2_9MYCO|nr:hypothetical protein [Mycobacterium parmense]MCV7348978.1 hypothetical protein [Mycobacterium parmense]ORW58325.1 hypothetical protein AWC20_11415 [Mycobacterium parmense]BBZ43145.1 hypothetical protein MPRM_04260 [Mycobacterium parmense]
MVRHEGGRWDVGIESDAVHVERISESDERLFDDSLAPQEARQLAGLLTKFADKLDESLDAKGSEDNSDGSEDAEKSDDAEDSKDSEKSEDAKDSKDGEDSDKSPDS